MLLCASTVGAALAVRKTDLPKKDAERRHKESVLAGKDTRPRQGL